MFVLEVNTVNIRLVSLDFEKYVKKDNSLSKVTLCMGMSHIWYIWVGVSWVWVVVSGQHDEYDIHVDIEYQGEYHMCTVILNHMYIFKHVTCTCGNTPTTTKLAIKEKYKQSQC